MIKTITAVTDEVDDIEAAIADILGQLRPEETLLKNSIGIVSCYSEFLTGGLVKALADSLPFHLVGTTTLGNVAMGRMGHMNLTITLLTSDEVEFSCAKTESLYDEQEGPLRTAYQAARNGLTNEPSFMLTFAPLINHVGGDLIVDTLDEITEHLPNFGTIAIDHNLNYETTYVIFDGEYFARDAVLLLLSGPLKPRFFVASISEEKIQKQKAIITDSSGNVLRQVNNIPISQYLASLGLWRECGIEGANTIPFVVDYGDGTKPVARAIYATTPEGYAVCGGKMPINSTLAIGGIDYEDVMRTSKQILADIQREAGGHFTLMFSCIARNLVLGADTYAEMQQVAAAFGRRNDYQFIYSGGEICPVCNEEGTLINRFHNDTFVACIL